jgi:hypothetical protein
MNSPSIFSKNNSIIFFKTLINDNIEIWIYDYIIVAYKEVKQSIDGYDFATTSTLPC